MKKYFLPSDWKMKPLTVKDIPVKVRGKLKSISAEVPGTVHTDLLKAKIIPDPFYADNENKITWIHETDWQYWTHFNLPPEIKSDLPASLVFEGLDTISEIFLNGKFLGRTENMFRRYEFPVRTFLKSKNNILLVKFRSPTRYGHRMEQRLGKLPVALNSTRVFLRKAQYSFGWDWGPVFPTMGIWRAVYLCQTEKARIKHVRFQVEKILPDKAQVVIHLDIDGNPGGSRIILNLEGDGKSLQSQIFPLQKKKVSIRMTIMYPRLWWPNGEGEPFLYQLKVFLEDRQGKIIDKWQGRVGVRVIKLVLNDKKKSVFKFYVNGRFVFVKGVNWIPADSFLPRVDKNSYQNLLTLARDAHVNMIRVWGGGIYEDDQFYQLCDELGLLVWQDFMFACGAYPESKPFVANIKEEIVQNVSRLQYHPSLAIWCGNNENEWIWYQQKRQAISTMPGFKIFHQVIPKIIAELDPLRPYWPTTPFGDDPDPNSEISGNRHQWDIWSYWKDYVDVKNDKSLFVSEFGFQGPANRLTMEKCLPVNARATQSPLFEFHNKQIEGNERIFRFLAAHLPVTSRWGDFIYLAQLNHGLALKECIEHWRLRSPKTAGSIIWQLNDCWPVTSWSLVDSQLIPKIAYYLVKEAFSPIVTIATFQDPDLNLVILNDSPQTFHGRVQAILFENQSGNMVEELNISLRIAARSLKKLERIFPRNTKKLSSWICVMSLYDQKNVLFHRNCFSNRRWKHLILTNPEVRLRPDQSPPQSILLISTSKLALFLDFYHPDLTFSPRGFISLPGETSRIYTSKSFTKVSMTKKIHTYSLNQYLLS